MSHRHVMSYHMARGESGRIVLEIDPTEKDELYSALTKDGLTLKDWFLRQASDYMRNRSQPSLFGGAALSETPAPYKTNKPAVKKHVPSEKRKGSKRK